jgi:hypothetical protein
VSQAAAQQRRGRAGRVRPGVCFRLFSRATWAALQVRTRSTFDAGCHAVDVWLKRTYLQSSPSPAGFRVLRPETCVCATASTSGAGATAA